MMMQKGWEKGPSALVEVCGHYLQRLQLLCPHTSNENNLCSAISRFYEVYNAALHIAKTGDIKGWAVGGSHLGEAIAFVKGALNEDSAEESVVLSVTERLEKIIGFDGENTIPLDDVEVSPENEVQCTHHVRVLLVPSLPDRYFHRADLCDRVKTHLFQSTPGYPVVLRGVWGSGKGMIASYLSRDEEVQKFFEDGILWIQMGKKLTRHDILQRQRTVARELLITRERFSDIDEGTNRLGVLSAEKKCLLVLRNATSWNSIRPFVTAVGSGLRLLVVAEECEDIVGLPGMHVHVSPLDLDESREFFSMQIHDSNTTYSDDDMNSLVLAGNGLPMSLSLLGRYIRILSKKLGEDVDKSPIEILKEFVDRVLREDSLYSDFGHDSSVTSVIRSLYVGVLLLQELRDFGLEHFDVDVRELYKQLSVLRLKHMPISVEIVNAMWGAEYAFTALKKLENWGFLSLLRPGNLLPMFYLHPIHAKFLSWYALNDIGMNVSSKVGEIRSLHLNFVQAISQKCSNGSEDPTSHSVLPPKAVSSACWWKLPMEVLSDGYTLENLVYHLTKAGMMDVVRRLMFNFHWLVLRFRHGHVTGILDDFSFILQDHDAAAVRLLFAVIPNVSVPDSTVSNDVQKLVGKYGTTFENMELLMVRNALELSSLSLDTDVSAAQFAGQLVAKLSKLPYFRIRSLLGQIRSSLEPWCFPLSTALEGMGGTCTMVLNGHTAGVLGCACSADGKYMASCSHDKTIRLWDLNTSECIREYVGHDGSVTKCQISPDRKLIVSCSWDGTLRVWDWESAECLRVLEGHSGAVNGCAMFPNGKRALSASSDETARVWDVMNGQCEWVLKGHKGAVTACDVSSNGRLMASASKDRTVRIWNSLGPSEGALKVLRGHKHWVTDCKFSFDGAILVTSSLDKTLRLWDVQNGNCLKVLHGHSDAVTGCFISKGGLLLSCSHDNSSKLWHLTSGTCKRSVIGHQDWINCCCISPDERYSITGADDTSVRVANTESNERVTTFTQFRHRTSVESCAVSKDDSMFLSTSCDGEVVVRSRDETVLASYKYHGICTSSVIFEKTSRIGVSSFDTTIKICSIDNSVAEQTLSGHSSAVFCLALSSDERTLVSGGDEKVIFVWDLVTGAVVRRLHGHKSCVSSVAFSPDGSVLASGSWDFTLKVWDAKRTWHCIRTLEGHENVVTCCSFSNDGRYIISGSSDSTLRVWDREFVVTKCVALLKGHTAGVTGCAVLADGDFVASASRDTTIRLWNLVSGLVVSVIYMDACITCLSVGGTPRELLCGDISGDLHTVYIRTGNQIRRPTLPSFKERDSCIANLWMCDKHTDTCLLCGKKFSVLSRKHHCRMCGGIFCGRCCVERVVPTELQDDMTEEEHWLFENVILSEV